MVTRKVITKFLLKIERGEMKSLGSPDYLCLMSFPEEVCTIAIGELKGYNEAADMRSAVRESLEINMKGAMHINSHKRTVSNI